MWQEDVFHHVEALERLDGDRSVLVELAEIFVEESSSMMDALREGISQDDAHVVSAQAHRLKGSSATLSGSLLTKAAAELERAANSGDSVAQREAWALLQTEFGRLQEALTAFLASAIEGNDAELP